MADVTSTINVPTNKGTGLKEDTQIVKSISFTKPVSYIKATGESSSKTQYRWEGVVKVRSIVDLNLRIKTVIMSIEDKMIDENDIMLNKYNYVSWSSRIIRYARSRQIGKMIIDSIENEPYVRIMIATPGEPDLPVLVPESFHEQTDEELTENDIKRMDADDQAIQTILLGLPEDVYAAIDSCETAKEIWNVFDN
nr:hypothetical protein [Tanacetum cinerariifolium]